MYRLEEKANCLEVIGRMGEFVASFDFNERGDATALVDELNKTKMYSYRTLVAEARWFSANGKKICVPAREFSIAVGSIDAIDEESARASLRKEYSNKGYLMRDTRVWLNHCERHN